MKPVQYETNTGRGPSERLWRDCDYLGFIADPAQGHGFFCDFQGNYALAANQTVTLLDQGICGYTGATAGSTISMTTTNPNGELHLETTTDNESIGIMALGGKNVAAQFLLTAGKQAWFEARIKVVNITDAKFGLFCGFAEEGLCAEDGILSDADALADKDYIGFVRIAADGDKLDTVHNKASGTAVVVKADAVTVVADTYLKVGFYCDGTKVYFFKDGVALADTCALATTTVPTDEEMAFYYILNAAHGDTCSAQIDWVRIAREL